MCQKHDTNRRCLSTGECRRCKYVSTDSDGTTVNRYEGCEGITSATPICDANGDTAIIDFATADYVSPTQNPSCAKCTKAGK